VRKLLVFGVALVALAVTASAQAYTRPNDPSSVAIVGCAAPPPNGHGGFQTVPADTPITVFAGWGAKTRGQVIDWLDASTNTLNVNGGPAIDMTPYFAGLTQEWNPGQWSDIFFYQIGSLSVGQSETVDWTWSTSRPTPDGSTQGDNSGGLAPHSPFTFTCTLTGA
jgi:hypothetical protein